MSVRCVLKGFHPRLPPDKHGPMLQQGFHNICVPDGSLALVWSPRKQPIAILTHCTTNKNLLLMVPTHAPELLVFKTLPFNHEKQITKRRGCMGQYTRKDPNWVPGTTAPLPLTSRSRRMRCARLGSYRLKLSETWSVCWCFTPRVHYKVHMRGPNISAVLTYLYQIVPGKRGGPFARLTHPHPHAHAHAATHAHTRTHARTHARN